nr:unnamed protein product [Callosobruchus chinensis]
MHFFTGMLLVSSHFSTDI